VNELLRLWGELLRIFIKLSDAEVSVIIGGFLGEVGGKS
jgi:hypothetical protein